jgi:DNA-binding IclR family transcriptional regulator
MEAELYRPRTLGPREAKVLAWLETNRPAVIHVADVAEAVGVSREYARTLVWRLERKGWLQRLTSGRYEPLLGSRVVGRHVIRGLRSTGGCARTTSLSPRLHTSLG